MRITSAVDFRTIGVALLQVCWSAVLAFHSPVATAQTDGKKKILDPLTGKALDVRLPYAYTGDATTVSPGGASENLEAKRALTNEAVEANSLNKAIRAVRKGDTVKVKVDNSDCTYTSIKFEEKERNSRLYNDIHAIVGKFKPSQPGVESGCPPLVDSYELQHNRSTLTITAVAKDEKQNASTTVISGQKEHLYLGIDIPGTRKTLKYDASTKTLQPRSDNPQVYLSLNYSFGDLAADESDASWNRLSRWSLKFLVLADKKPLNSYGIGAGYQMPKLDVVDLSAISVFAGRFWTKQDAISSDGAGQTDVATARDWRLGISFDVAAGLKWLKGN